MPLWREAGARNSSDGFLEATRTSSIPGAAFNQLIPTLYVSAANIKLKLRPKHSGRNDPLEKIRG